MNKQIIFGLLFSAVLMPNLNSCSQILNIYGKRPINTSPDSTGLSVADGKSGQSGSIRIMGVEEYAKERNNELFTPQDEFETSTEYSHRVELQKTYLDELQKQLLAEIENRKQEKKRLETEKIEEEERQLQNKIAMSLAPVDELVSAISDYNAENESFEIEVNNNFYLIYIPRN